ncbi:MAG: helix-turn-helix domain-containing protein [Kiritimatiellia bacterium]|nr:helix-turn-helix domain-containing protein [Kiritimatiellia bacterium]HXK78747.1 helix-turn-helix domain-containing protein [Kiritimatiellia bacterium]
MVKRKKIPQLNPTLWRTCRVLAGETRLKLIRQLHQSKGAGVTDLAKAVGIGGSDASQELRRIQSRGLLRVERKRSFVFYRFGADPQVPSAAPLVKALLEVLGSSSEKQDAEIIRIAWGLAHPRRGALVQALLMAPKTLAQLGRDTGIPRNSVSRHIGIMEEAGWVAKQGQWLVGTVQPHPIARTLAQLLQE